LTFKETTARKLFDELYEVLQQYDTPEEQKAKLFHLLEERLGLTRTDIVAGQPVTLKLDEYERLQMDVQKLKEGFPVQQITGKSWFYGREFKVNPTVLIPRPETEELVHLIINENKDSRSRILDIGTGSGCIPITLKAEMKSAEVWGMDNSQEALEVARENARSLDVEVDFIHRDVFDDTEGIPQVGIIVSNPPYVPECEKQNMQREVLLHEPHQALFVDNDNPLIFYRRIAEVGNHLLEEGGKLYFEIHKDYGKAIKDLLISYGYKNINIIKDIHNKDRIISAEIE
jgi:release factor glutamine methyltransferase